ncbi:MAG: hypothetical protein ACK4Q5_10525, partial [Saprospiraceae bacterium]
MKNSPKSPPKSVLQGKNNCCDKVDFLPLGKKLTYPFLSQEYIEKGGVASKSLICNLLLIISSPEKTVCWIDFMVCLKNSCHRTFGDETVRINRQPLV